MFRNRYFMRTLVNHFGLDAEIASIRSFLHTGLSGAYLLTLLTEIGVLLSTLLTLRLAASFYGVNGFGEYAVAKRAFSLLTFPLLVGLGISLPRYIALNATREKKYERQAFLFSGIAISILMLGLFAVLPLFFPSQFTWLFFGDNRHWEFSLPILFTVAGLYFQTLLYGYLRGEMRMAHANLLRCLTVIFVPPVALLFSGHSASRGVLFTGFGWIGVSLIFGVFILSEIELAHLTRENVWVKIKELLSFGLPRVPGEFALFGLFSLPTLIISHQYGVEEAGYFSFGISLLQMIGALFAAVGILLLPYISNLVTSESWEKINTVVRRIYVLSLSVSTLGVILLQILLPFGVRLLMGEEFLQAVPQIRWVILGAIPYVSYVILRNPLDAIEKWPYNSLSLIITLVILLGLIMLNNVLFTPQFSIFFSLVILGLLTLYFWAKRINQSVKAELG